MYIIKMEPAQNPAVVQCEKKLSLGFLQKAVDGNIETAPLRPCYSRLIPGILMIINENGKLHRHDFNGIATAIFDTALDYIAGTALIVKRDGEDLTGFTAEEINRLKAFMEMDFDEDFFDNKEVQ